MHRRRGVHLKKTALELEVESMLSKCVNPSCQATFRYLHEGKLFKLEGSDPRFKTLGIKPVNSEYFWLCSECAVQMTVVFQNGGVLVQPLPKNVVIFDSEIFGKEQLMRALAHY
jgi:hypothetical protein